MLSWQAGDDIRGSFFGLYTMDGADVVAQDGLMRVRSVDPYDALYLAGAGVPQPVDAVRAHILNGGETLANTLQAVVSPDNSVVTLMLETGVGTYVRYLGSWQQLQDTSQSLEDLELVTVGPGSLQIFDSAQNANTTLSVFDLPTPSASDAMGDPALTVPGEVPLDDDSGTLLPVAAGARIPVVAAIEDLDLGLRYASVHPSARWYMAKRAQALGAFDRVPTYWWEKAG
jgi:hypothetical protein